MTELARFYDRQACSNSVISSVTQRISTIAILFGDFDGYSGYFTSDGIFLTFSTEVLQEPSSFAKQIGVGFKSSK